MITATTNTPLLTAGPIPVALLCAFNPVIEEVEIIRLPPMYLEKRGKPWYPKPAEEPKNYKPFRFTDQPWYQDMIKRRVA